jgi:hypothetical protein
MPARQTRQISDLHLDDGPSFEEYLSDVGLQAALVASNCSVPRGCS